MKEVLQHYPIIPVGFSHVFKKDVEIEGYPFRQEEALAVAAHLLHHNPKIYREDNKFKADQFLRWQPDSYDFLPFGGGTRLCIGNEFSLAVLREFWLAVLHSDRTLRLATQYLMVEAGEV